MSIPPGVGSGATKLSPKRRTSPAGPDTVEWVTKRQLAAWERDSWLKFEQISAELVGLSEDESIVRVALAESLELFRCQRVDVVLYPHRNVDALTISVLASPGGEHIRVRPFAVDDLPSDHSADVVVTPIFGTSQQIGHLAVHVHKPRGRQTTRRQTRRRLMTIFSHLIASTVVAERARSGQDGSIEHTEGFARYDSLTSLGDRSLLLERGPGYLANSAQHGKTAALLLLDLDDFKRINDTLGHTAGDQVLAEVGRRIGSAVRETDLAIRFGGDEFVVLARDLKSPRDSERIADKLLRAFTPTFHLDDVELAVSASVGIAVYGTDGESLEDLLREADRAMYEAKASGGGLSRRPTRVFVAAGDQRSLMTDDLRRALVREELVVHYQPQVSPRTGEVTGFEALARWQHPELGMLPPRDFVPLAERSGMINALTAVVLDRALSDHRIFARLAPNSSVSVNISARSLLGSGLVADVRRLLATHGVPASQLILEIAEPASGYSSSIAEVLGALEHLGCSVSVHEFGSGNSSLTALSQYRGIREVKIDPRLVASVPVDPAAERLVRAMVIMSHALDARVVAEGIESVDLVTALRDLGCDTLQGYYISGAAPCTEIEDWLARWPSLRTERLDIGRPRN